MTTQQVGMEQVGTTFEGLLADPTESPVPKWKVENRVVMGATRLAPRYTLPNTWKELEDKVFLVGYCSDGTASREMFVRPLQEGGLVFGQPSNPTPVEVAGFEDSECYLLVEDNRRIVRIHTPVEDSSVEMASQQALEAAQVAGACALQAEQ